MPERTSMLSAGTPARVNLRPYSAELPLGTLAVGVDNIHHDVFLSPTFVETTEAYLLEFIRQTANLPFLSQTDRIADRTGGNPRAARPTEKPRARPRLLPGSGSFPIFCTRGFSRPSTRRILRLICCFAWLC